MLELVRKSIFKLPNLTRAHHWRVLWLHRIQYIFTLLTYLSHLEEKIKTLHEECKGSWSINYHGVGVI